jgi:RecB family endonuclease NucS
MVKADGSLSVHADDRAYKPLNWMSPPCTLTESMAEDGSGTWTVTNKAGEQLVVTIEEVAAELSYDLGVDPGLSKDGVEAHLQELLAAHIETLGAGWRLVRREYPTAIGPVDLLARDADGQSIAIEIKRRGEIDGVEQLTRYLDLLNRDPLLAPVAGVFAAQEIKPQARVLATDRGIRCVTLDYDALRGVDDPDRPAVLRLLGGRDRAIGVGAHEQRRPRDQQHDQAEQGEPVRARHVEDHGEDERADPRVPRSASS